MISWKLWRALTHPPRHHPLFKYALAHAKKEQPGVAPGFFMWMFMCSTLTLIWTFVFDWLPYLIMGAIVLFNMVYAFRWTLRISRTIVEEKEAHRYDLLAALPIGLLGISWAISTGCLHRRSSFRWMPYLMLMLAVVTTITMVIIVLLTLFVLSSDLTSEAILANISLLELAIMIMPFMFGFYFDHLYSILTATLMGMIATIDVRNNADAQLRAALGFAAIQMTIYAVLYTVLVIGLPELFAFVSLTGTWFLIIESVIGLGLFLLIRESLVRWMWRYITYAFSAEANEVELVLKPNTI